MKRISKQLILCLLLIAGLVATSGCTNIMEEDPNAAQLPWATPANWEGTVPGMPNPGGY
ncbi:MAG TPA: hypothetical protein VK995_04645 [Oceanipulchritudo sp.]|nr:hypothetical protein [Oceanipulchritudo sp.]